MPTETPKTLSQIKVMLPVIFLSFLDFSLVLGREFLGLKAFFQQKGIHFRLKKPPIKAAYVECMIFHLKRKLYTLMRHLDNTHWETLLPQIVSSMNKAKHASLGGLSPVNLTSNEKAAQIDVALGFKNLPRYHDFFFNDRKEIEKSGPLVVGDFVHICLPDPRVRGFHVQVRKSHFSNGKIYVSISPMARVRVFPSHGWLERRFPTFT